MIEYIVGQFFGGMFWGLIKKTILGWIVIVLLLALIVSGLSINPTLFNDPITVAGSIRFIIGIISFLIGSDIGEAWYDDYWGKN